MNTELTQERLKELLHYDPDTGIFTWKVAKSSKVRIGSIAGNDHPSGYIIIQIDWVQYRAHRLAFLYMEGYLPENIVDHKNRIKNNNWWDNLREVSQSCNMRNSKSQCDTSSGVKGICWNKNENKWIAYICIKKKLRHLGYFKDFNEAVCTRLAAEQCLDWSGCDTNSPAFDFVERWICGRRLKLRKRSTLCQCPCT